MVRYLWDVAATFLRGIMETYNWDILMMYHRDVAGCFIWDYFEMSWRSTNGTSLLRTHKTLSRRSLVIPWRLTTETSCDVPSRRRWVLHLRRTCNVDETDRKTYSQRPLAGWYERFWKNSALWFPGLQNFFKKFVNLLLPLLHSYTT